MAREGALEDPAVPPDVGPTPKRLPRPRRAPDVAGAGPDPDVAAETPNPDVPRPENGGGALVVDSDPDVEEDPDVQPPKKLKITQNVLESPDVEAETPNPDVARPKIGSQAFSVDSDTDVEEDPDVEPQKGLRMTQNVPESPDVEVETPNPDVGRLEMGQWALVVDSDTDVEEDPDVQPQKKMKRTRNVPETPDVAGKTPNPDVPAPKNGSQALLVDSDTDVEDDANPDVRLPKRFRVTRKAPRIPDVELETPNPDVERPKPGHRTLLEDSDTDAEADPDVQPQKQLSMTQNVLETPDVAAKGPNPDVPGPKIDSQAFSVDSDTDVEEDPDVEPPKRLKRTRNVPESPDVATNPDVPGPEIGSQALLEDSDTDVEDDANPDVQPKKRLKMTQNVLETPDVETPKGPNPDVPGPKIDSQAFSVDSDTDVEADPDVQPQKRLRMTQNVLETPDVASKGPNPDVPAPKISSQAFLVDSDADVEEDPDVQPQKRLSMSQDGPEIPDVQLGVPNPDVPGPEIGSQALLEDSDTDVETDPDVQPQKQLKRTQKVPETPDVATKAPNPDVPNPKIGFQVFLVDSDTDVEDHANPDVQPKKRLKMTQNVPETPDVETPKGPNPDVPSPKIDSQAFSVDSDTDVEEDPDVEPQKGLRMTQNVPGTPDVEVETPNPDVPAPKIGSRALLEDSDPDVETDPDVQPQKRLKRTQKVPETPDVATKAPNPDVPGPKIGSQAFSVDSDTDVEEDPDVQPQKRLSMTQNVPETPDVEVETPNPDVPNPKNGSQALLEDSDTDVEDDANPDVNPPKRLRATQEGPGIPDVAANPDVPSPKIGSQAFSVDSDTDVEEDPDVQPQKRLSMTQNVPETPDVEVETPNPDVPVPKNGSQALLEDSDTDVESDANPDVQPPKLLRMTQNVPETPNVATRTPNPDVPNPKINSQAFLVDSDTDVENDANPDVQPPKGLRMTQNVLETPDVQLGMPNPDVPAPKNGSQALLVDSDTDVETDPDVQPPKRLRMTKKMPSIPDVEVETPNPDVGRPKPAHRTLVVDSDTDVEADPDVQPRKGLRMTQNIPEAPDVEVETPNPDVPAPKIGSQPDVEDDTDPDVQPQKRLKMTQNVPETPDVATKPPDPDVPAPKIGSQAFLVDSGTDVGLRSPDPDVGSQKTPEPAPNVPETPDVEPNPAVSSPQMGGGAVLGGSGPDVAGDPDVRPPKRRRTARNAAGIPDVEGAGESDPDVAPQLFLPPSPDVGSPKGLKATPNPPRIPDVAEEDGSEPDVDTQMFPAANPDVGSTESPKMPLKDPKIPDVEEENGSDPDVEAEDDGSYPDVATQMFPHPNPDVESPKQLKAGPNPPKIPDVGEDQGLDPDVEGVEGSDPDVATQLFPAPNPDVETPKRLKTPQNPPRIPDVAEDWPDPDVEEEDGSYPDVATQMFPAPNPDVGSAESPKTPLRGPQMPDVEEEEEWDPDVATQMFLPPHPDVGSPKLKISPNPPKIPAVEEEAELDPDVAGAEGSDPDVATQLFLGPNPDVETPKRLKTPQKLPRIPDMAEEDGSDPDVEHEDGSYPDVATQLFPAPNPDVGTPKRPKTTQNPPRIPDVEEEEELDPDVEDEPDPDVATQLFPAPNPDVGAQEPPGIPDVEREPPDPDVGAAPGPGPEVRRSRRLAESRGGGACAEPKPRPLRSSDQSEAGIEEATPSAPIKGNGRGLDVATPPEEEEPAGGAKSRLRPQRAPGPAHIRVLFTGLVASPALLVALGSLGGTEATSVQDCTHLVTDGIRRTLKFLCAVGRGVPIVTPEWLIQSSQGGTPLSPAPFLPRDPPLERRLRFRLSSALERARGHPLLQGYGVHVTPGVQPCPQAMQDIVTCCGGTFLPLPPREHRPDILVISCPQDRALWAPFEAARLPLLSAEFLLSGALRQRLELRPFLLQKIPNSPQKHKKKSNSHRKSKNPQRKNSNFSPKSKNPAEKNSNCAEKSKYSQQKYSDSAQKSKNSQQKNSNFTQESENSGGKNSDSAQKSKNSQQKNSDSAQKSKNSEEKSPNSTQKSKNSQQKNSNFTQESEYSGEKNSDFNQKSEKSARKNSDSAQKSKNSEQKTLNSSQKSKNPEQKNSDSSQKSKNSQQKSPNFTQKSPNSAQKSPNSAQNFQNSAQKSQNSPQDPPRTRSGRRPPQNPPQKIPNSPQKSQNFTQKNQNFTHKSQNFTQKSQNSGGSSPPPSPPRTRSGRRPPQKIPNSGNPQKTPNPPQKSPNPPQKSQNFPQKSQNFPQKNQNFPQKNQNFPQKNQNFAQKTPNPPQNPPQKSQILTPNASQKIPNSGNPKKIPNLPQKNPKRRRADSDPDFEVLEPPRTRSRRGEPQNPPQKILNSGNSQNPPKKTQNFNPKSQNFTPNPPQIPNLGVPDPPLEPPRTRSGRRPPQKIPNPPEKSQNDPKKSQNDPKKSQNDPKKPQISPKNPLPNPDFEVPPSPPRTRSRRDPPKSGGTAIK